MTEHMVGVKIHWTVSLNVFHKSTSSTPSEAIRGMIGDHGSYTAAIASLDVPACLISACISLFSVCSRLVVGRLSTAVISERNLGSQLTALIKCLLADASFRSSPAHLRL